MPVEVTMPRLSDSMEEGTIAAWLVAEGDSVTAGQPLVEIETDKATMAYESESGGVVGRILVPEGDTAALGAPIAVLLGDGEELGAEEMPAAAEAPTPAPVPASGPASASTQAATAGTATATRPKASPLARRAARELGVDLTALSGNGPGGRIVLADVKAAAAADSAAPPATAPSPAAAAPSPAPDASRPSDPSTAPELETAKGRTIAIEPSRLQATVARRMAESRATVPNFDLQTVVDMTAAREMRDQLRGVVDPLPSFNDLVVMAGARAMRENPRANGSYREGRFELHGRVNVGIAVAAEDALVVPTIFDADIRTLGGIAVETRRLAAAVRDGSITAADLSGGTFTVSNLGMFGITAFSAVINPPQAAILAVGAIVERPAVLADGTIGPRPEMTLTLCCDHRILYGAEAAVVLGRIRALLEAPTELVIAAPRTEASNP